MNLIESPSFTIYFGNAYDGLSRLPLINDAFFSLKRMLNARALVFANQVHGIQNIVIHKKYLSLSPILYLSQEADSLLTREKGIGIGVMMADCLPIVIYDSSLHSAAVVHAGWKGSCQNILVETIQKMQNTFASKIENLVFYFGPSAQKCCYEVQKGFFENLSLEYQEICIEQRDRNLYFDNTLFNILQLEKRGISRDAIHVNMNACTICHHTFHSYRRSKENAGRQSTIVLLK